MDTKKKLSRKKPLNWLSLNDAVSVLKEEGISSNRVTFTIWAKTYNLGRKIGGRWVIYPERLDKFLQKNFHIERVYHAKKKQKQKGR